VAPRPAVVFASRDAAQVWERAVREPVAPRPAVVFASRDAAQVWERAVREPVAPDAEPVMILLPLWLPLLALLLSLSHARVLAIHRCACINLVL